MKKCQNSQKKLPHNPLISPCQWSIIDFFLGSENLLAIIAPTSGGVPFKTPKNDAPFFIEYTNDNRLILEL